MPLTSRRRPIHLKHHHQASETLSWCCAMSFKVAGNLQCGIVCSMAHRAVTRVTRSSSQPSRQSHLEQTLTNSATSTPLSAPLQLHRELFSNSYDLLTVDEPAESPTGWVPSSQESARPAKARVIVELRDVPEDSREFEIWCVPRQGYDIRQHLLSLWKSTPK